MDTRLPAVAAECSDHLHDSAGRKQAPEGVGIRPAEPSALAAVDCGERGMGAAAEQAATHPADRKIPTGFYSDRVAT